MDRETKIQIRETIIILVTTVVVLAIFAFCVSLPAGVSESRPSPRQGL